MSRTTRDAFLKSVAAVTVKSRTSVAAKVWVRPSAADRDPVARGRQHELLGGDDPDLDRPAGGRLERVAVVGPVERDAPADPRQPAVEVGDAVRPGEQPVRAGHAAAEGGVIANPDPRRAARWQHAAERHHDRLVADAGRDGAAIDRHRLEPDRAESRRDRVELDPVDGAAGRVADRRQRVDVDLARTPAEPQVDVVGRVEQRARSVDEPRHDVAAGGARGTGDRGGEGQGGHRHDGGQQERQASNHAVILPRRHPRSEGGLRRPRRLRP